VPFTELKYATGQLDLSFQVLLKTGPNIYHHHQYCHHFMICTSVSPSVFFRTSHQCSEHWDSMQCEDGFHEEMSVVAKLTPRTFSNHLIIYSDAGYSLLSCVLNQPVRYFLQRFEKRVLVGNKERGIFFTNQLSRYRQERSKSGNSCICIIITCGSLLAWQ